MKMRFSHFAAFLIAALVASTAHSASPSADFEAMMSHDGLKRVNVKGISVAYARPGATLAAYKRVKIDPVEVAFDKDWKASRAGSRIPLSTQELEEIRTGLAKLVQEQFVKALEAKGRYPVVKESGPDVLRLRIYIVNLKVTAPANAGIGRTATFTMSAGEMTLFMEVFDSETGQIIARVVDRREGRADNVMRMSTRVTDMAQAEDIAAEWARILRDALDRAHDAAKK